jgi:hypothetical protein
MAQPAEYLTPAQLAQRWEGAVTTGTLANWRSKGIGPAFQKFGSRVRYPLAQVATWEAANLHGANDNDNKTEAIKNAR